MHFGVSFASPKMTEDSYHSAPQVNATSPLNKCMVPSGQTIETYAIHSASFPPEDIEMYCACSPPISGGATTSISTKAFTLSLFPGVAAIGTPPTSKRRIAGVLPFRFAGSAAPAALTPAAIRTVVVRSGSLGSEVRVMRNGMDVKAPRARPMTLNARFAMSTTRRSLRSEREIEIWDKEKGSIGNAKLL